MAISNDKVKGGHGLVGGDPEIRARTRKVEEVAHPWFWRPLESKADAESLYGFCAEGPLAVELGFGRGYFLGQFSLLHPEWQCLGVEVKRKLCRIALDRFDRWGVTRGRILLGDARALLPRFLPPRSVDLFFILFPDPWWKKKHHKRRVLDAEHLAAFLPVLSQGARIIVRSDVPMVLDLAREALHAIGGSPEELSDLVLPQTDRERVCDRIGIPYDQVVYRFSFEARS